MIELKREYKIEGCTYDKGDRENLSQPFFTGRHIIATDGSILAIVPVKVDKADIPGRLDGKLLANFRKQGSKYQDVVFGLGPEEQVQPLSGLKGPRPEINQHPQLGTIIRNARQGRPGENQCLKVKINPWQLVKLAEGIGVEKKGRNSGVELNLHFKKGDEVAGWAMEVLPLDSGNKAFGILMPIK